MSGPRAVFAFIREGTSDDGLIPHLRELLSRAGLPEVVGSPRDYPGSVDQRLTRLAAEATPVDIVFVHRDADESTSDSRREEVLAAVEKVPMASSFVIPVVPIQEIEAWLLLDSAAIRTVVGRPKGTVPLDLPRLSRVESTSSPKQVLKTALLTASESTGRRRKDEQRRFQARRRTLLERLDIDGPVRELSAWRRLEEDIEQVVPQVLDRID